MCIRIYDILTRLIQSCTERYIGFPGSTATIAEIRDWCGKDGGMAEIGTRANGKVFGWEDVRMSHIQYVSPAANRIYMYL